MSPRNGLCSVPSVVLCVTALAACETTEVRGPEVVERDSAGIRIVENRGAAPAAVWRVAELPSLEIGVEDGDSMQLLFRVGAALVVGEGEIVIANGATPMLRWYDRSGAFLRGTGRTGGGPGEFQGMEGGPGYIVALWPVGPDSVATWEHPPRRMMVFGPDAAYARSVILELPPDMPPGAYPSMVGRMGADGFVAQMLTYAEPRNVGGTWRDTVTYSRWNADGTFAATLARLPGSESFNSEFMGRRSRGRAPFGRPQAAWADAGGFYYGGGETFEVLAFDPSGALRRIIRRDAPVRPLGQDVIEAFVQQRMQDAPAEADVRQAWEASLRAAPFPENLPPYRRIRTDRLGHLWVQEYDVPTEPDVAWHVFDPSGSWIAQVRVPTTWQIQDIGQDYILVLTTNELDVEVVQLYALNRLAAASD